MEFRRHFSIVIFLFTYKLILPHFLIFQLESIKTQLRYWCKTIGPSCNIVPGTWLGSWANTMSTVTFPSASNRQHTPLSEPQNTSYFGVWLICEIPSTLSLKRINNFHSISELWALMNGGFAKDEKFNSLSLKAHYVSLSLHMTQSLHMLPHFVCSLSLATSCMKGKGYWRHAVEEWYHFLLEKIHIHINKHIKKRLFFIIIISIFMFVVVVVH